MTASGFCTPKRCHGYLGPISLTDSRIGSPTPPPHQKSGVQNGRDCAAGTVLPPRDGRWGLTRANLTPPLGGFGGPPVDEADPVLAFARRLIELAPWQESFVARINRASEAGFTLGSLDPSRVRTQEIAVSTRSGGAWRGFRADFVVVDELSSTR